jgi:hypothetical protein
MSTIIAGLFENIEQAGDAEESLRRHGFGAGDVCHFANNPPGQHDRFPIGGDENADPGARHAHAGTVAGAGVGAGAGAAVGALVAGPPGAAVGAGVGAYVGSLAGTLNQLEGKGSDSRPVRRPAGVMVAARVDGAQPERTAVAVLRAEGAQHVERAQGTWSDGKWVDFEAVDTPEVIAPGAEEPGILPEPTPAGRQPVYRVQRAGEKWEADLGASAPRQTFDLRQEAVSHAIAAAESQPRAVVEVYGKDGGLVWREFYDAATASRRMAGP